MNLESLMQQLEIKLEQGRKDKQRIEFLIKEMFLDGLMLENDTTQNSDDYIDSLIAEKESEKIC